MYKKQKTGNSVIEEGYALYDEWCREAFSPRKILALAERVVVLISTRDALRARSEALSFLFALDILIKEKFNTFFRRLFAYFAWRRIARARKMLSVALNLPIGKTDIRTLIEVELKKLRRQINLEEEEEGEDEVGGGKRNGQSQEEAVTAKENEAEPTQEVKENADTLKEESSEAEEVGEEITENKEEIPEIPQEEAQEEKAPDKVEVKQDDTKFEKTTEKADRKEEVREEKPAEVKEQKLPEQKIPEPITENKKEEKTYNDAPDFESADENLGKKEEEDTVSFIDNVIMDNMVKGKENYINHNPLADVKQDKEAIRITEESMRDSNQDGKWQDRNFQSERGNQRLAREDGQNANSNEVQERDKHEELRVKLNVDILANKDKLKNDEVTEEVAKKVYKAQAEVMRVQLDIASEEHGIDAPVEIIGVPEAPKPTKNTAPNLKR